MKYFFCFLILFTICSEAQDEKSRLFIKNDDKYRFIDNTYYCWFTVDFVADTIIAPMDGNIFLVDSIPVQIFSNIYNWEKFSVKGDTVVEKEVLDDFVTLEMQYQEQQQNHKLDITKEFFKNSKGKNFLLWYFEIPDHRDEELSLLQYDTEESAKIDSPKLVMTYKFAHTIDISFITNRNVTTITLSNPEDRQLLRSLNYIKQLAESIDVFGSYIDVEVISNRFRSKEYEYIISDSTKSINIPIPNWLNPCLSNHNFSYLLSLPEIANISNAIAIVFEYRVKEIEFDDFVKRVFENTSVVSYESIENINGYAQYRINSNNSLTTNYIIFENKEVYCWIQFVATQETYPINYSKFKSFIERIELL